MLKFSTKWALTLRAALFCILLGTCNFQAISQADSAGAPVPPDQGEQAAAEADGDSTTDVVQKDRTVIYHFKLYEDIMPNAGRLVTKALKAASDAGADIILLELNTYGGRVDIADSIRTKLLNAEALTVAFIVNNAASAGALISLACDSIYMKGAASIGAATVVSGETGEQMPDKYQSYMRSKMRATAEKQGRDPDIAEAMVDDRIYIPGIIDSGQVLTFTASEALEHNFCDGLAESLDEVIEALGVEDYEIIEHELSAADKVIAFLLNPIVSSILMLMIFGGIYFELQTPGIGFPLTAAIIGATLYFGPLYIEGLAANWEIVLFVVGIILIGVELFVLPGFGVAGSLGIALIVGSLTLSLINNDFFDFSLSGTRPVAMALVRVVLTLFVGIGLVVAFGGSLLNTPAFQRISLQDRQTASTGYTILKANLAIMIGEKALAITDLRPAGKIEFEDEIYDAQTEGGYLERGTEVKILKMEGNTFVVRKLV